MVFSKINCYLKFWRPKQHLNQNWYKLLEEDGIPLVLQFICNPWKGTIFTQSGPKCFVFWGERRVKGGGRFSFFTLFPMCPNYVPNQFSLSFQYLPQVPNVFPKTFPIAPDFYCICFGKCCPPSNCIGGPKGRNSIL
jgi:hypothetical protein